MNIVRFFKKISLVAVFALFAVPSFASAASGDIIGTYTVGAPTDITFDSSTNSVWLFSTTDLKVKKLRASDGASLGSYSTVSWSGGMIFDSFTNSVWISDYLNGRVVKVRISDGVTVASTVTNPGFADGNTGLAFDSASNSIWVSNVTSPRISKVRASDGVLLAGYSLTGPSGWNGATFDASTNSIWVTDGNNNTIIKLRASDGLVLGTYPIGFFPGGIVFDPSTNSIWVTNFSSNTIKKIGVSDGAVIGTYTIGLAPIQPIFDPSTNSIWVTNNNSGTVSKIRASDGGILGTYTVGTKPYGLTFDPSTNSIWVTNQNSDTVVKLSTGYIPTGTINVTSNIPGASWTITGPATLTGSGTSRTYSSQPTGTYTITWTDVAGYITPSPQLLTLIDGGTIPFDGIYTAIVAPTVSTTAVSGIGQISATSGGDVTLDGGDAVTARGVVWSTSSNPTTALATKTSDGTGIGVFTSAITGLTANTTYHVRAYATNSIGTSYGSDVPFTTAVAPVAPTVSTTAVSGIGQISATSGGDVTLDGGDAVTARGVIWDTALNPTTALATKTSDGTGIGVFTSNITGLTANTTYHVRAYATNGIGTSYGSDVPFTTAAIPPPPPSPSITYAVTQSGASDFQGWAWGSDVMGWISFNSINCDTDTNGWLDVACGGANNSSGKALSPYKVYVVGTLPCSPPTASLLQSNFTDRCTGPFNPTIGFTYKDNQLNPLAQYTIRIYDASGPTIIDTFTVTYCDANNNNFIDATPACGGADDASTPLMYSNGTLIHAGSAPPIPSPSGISITYNYSGSSMLAYGHSYYYTVTVQSMCNLN